MGRTISASDLGSTIQLWNHVLPNKFRTTPEQFLLNTTDSGLVVDEATRFDEDGFVVVKRSGYGLFDGPEPTWYHIHCLISPDDAARAQLLDHALGVVRGLGATKVFYGQDLRHFFPGPPVECTELQQTLENAGFQKGGECVDLERDMVDYTVPAGVFERAGNAEFRACTADDVPLLAEFLNREFPRRWKYDVLRKIELENRPDIVFGVFVDGVCEGFALTQEAGCKVPIAGAVWNPDLGPQWGSLGPIGVSERVRGRGLGNAILAFGLQGLHERGARRSIIDWTTLIEFYGIHGFEVNRRYIPMHLDLA